MTGWSEWTEKSWRTRAAVCYGALDGHDSASMHRLIMVYAIFGFMSYARAIEESYHDLMPRMTIEDYADLFRRYDRYICFGGLGG